MTYKELLNRTINRAGLKNVELIEELKNRGISITPNYLSVLRNNEDKIPSIEISRTIAEICNAPKDLLVIQGDLDRLEGGLKDYIMFAVKNSYSSAELGLKMYGTKEQLDILHNMCEADIICDFIEHPDDYKTEIDKLLDGIDKGMLNDKSNHKWAIIPVTDETKIKVVDSLDKLEEQNS